LPRSVAGARGAGLLAWRGHARRCAAGRDRQPAALQPVESALPIRGAPVSSTPSSQPMICHISRHRFVL